MKVFENDKHFVIIESPYAPTPKHSLEEHVAYARAAMADCFKRGEIPFGSHVIYTQKGVLDDTKPAERRKGMQAGFDVARLFNQVGGIRAIYEDLGTTKGMLDGLAEAQVIGQVVEYRSITDWKWPLWKRFLHSLLWNLRRLWNR